MGLLVGILIWFVSLALAIPFFTQWWWMPDPITEHGRQVDQTFMMTLVITGVIFVLAQGGLGYAVWKFGRRSDEHAANLHGNNKLEATERPAGPVVRPREGWSVSLPALKDRPMGEVQAA